MHNRRPAKILVHHTATPNVTDFSRTQAVRLARSIQNYHIDRQRWADSGQHFTISRGGYVLEGRHRSLEMLRGGRRMVEGAHCTGQNIIAVGIENEGTYTTTEPTTQQWNRLREMCAYVCQQYRVRPTEIYGHRDFKDTACPGDALYKMLPKLRTEVAALLREDTVRRRRRAPRPGRCCGWPTAGADVQAAQHLLRAAGHTEVVPDGRFDRRTADAVRRFQQANGTEEVNGMIGGESWPLLVVADRHGVHPGDRPGVAGAQRRPRRRPTWTRPPGSSCWPEEAARGVAADPTGFGPPRWLPHSPQPADRGVGTLPRAGADLDWRRCAITRTQRGARIPEHPGGRGGRVPGRPAAGPRGRRPHPTGCAASTSSAPAGTARPRCSTRWPRPCSQPASRSAGTCPARARSSAGRSRCWSTTPTAARRPSWTGWSGWPPARTATWWWPTARGRGPTGTAALGAALAARRPPVVLDVLDRAGVLARATLRLGEPAASAGSGRRPAGRAGARADRRAAGAGRPAARRAGRAGRRDRARIPLPDRSPPGLLVQLGYTVPAQEPGVRGLLLARALGAPVEAEVLVPLLGVTGGPAALDELLEAARAAGLLTADGLAVPLISDAVLARTPAGSRSELLRALAEIELGRGGNIRTAARGLLDAGHERGPGGRGVQRGGRGGAADRWTGGRRVPGRRGAGRRPRPSSWPPAAPRPPCSADDLDIALTQADQVFAAPDRVPADDLARAGTAAAAVLARRGMLARSAELHRWMGAVDRARLGDRGAGADRHRRARRGPRAAARLRRSRLAPGAPPSIRPPTLLAGAEELMAKGVYDSVAGSPTAALSALTRAAALLETSYRAALLPDTPAALAALVAVHCGEHDVPSRCWNGRSGCGWAARARPPGTGCCWAGSRCPAGPSRPPGRRCRPPPRPAPRWSRATSCWPRRWRWRWPGAPATWPR